MYNDLREFFYNRTIGPGIWKWDHYLEIYDKHFSRFRNRLSVNVVEIGVYSGGSLDMWRHYFGPQARIIGIDVEPDCSVYERDGVTIYIGDQSSKAFWSMFRTSEPNIDIVIDDGSHKHRHQILTFDEIFPHIRAGGIYLCEDIHGYPTSEFAEYIAVISQQLHEHIGFEKHRDNNDRRLVKKTTLFQKEVKSISFYPYVCVVEKNEYPVEEFVAPKRGTEWQPFTP